MGVGTCDSCREKGYGVASNVRIHEDKFIKEAAEVGLVSLKGHKLVGGCRASLYNAMSFEGTYALINFMKKFMQENPKQA